jgi:anti-sigma factor RsiW
MSDIWTERLSEYLDGTLAGSERTEMETHLAGCTVCRATLQELERVVARAQRLEDRPPQADLWPGIARRIAEARVVPFASRRRLTFTVPQLIAAAVALAVLSTGGAWLVLRSRPATSARPLAGAPLPAAVQWVSAVDRSYDRTVAELQRTLDDGQRNGRLDSATVRVLTRSLATIDTAIAQARRALAQDPGSDYLNHHLAETMRRKVGVLRQANSLMQRL